MLKKLQTDVTPVKAPRADESRHQRLWSPRNPSYSEGNSSVWDCSDDDEEAEWEGESIRQERNKIFYECVSKRNGNVKFRVGDDVLLLAPGKSVPYVAKIDELFEDDSVKLASVRWYYRESDCDSKALSERNKKIVGDNSSDDGASRPRDQESSSNVQDTGSNVVMKKIPGKEVFASACVDINSVDTFLKLCYVLPVEIYQRHKVEALDDVFFCRSSYCPRSRRFLPLTANESRTPERIEIMLEAIERIREKARRQTRVGPRFQVDFLPVPRDVVSTASSKGGSTPTSTPPSATSSGKRVRATSSTQVQEGQPLFLARTAFGRRPGADGEHTRRPPAVDELVRKWVDLLPGSAGVSEEQVLLALFRCHGDARAADIQLQRLSIAAAAAAQTAASQASRGSISERRLASMSSTHSFGLSRVGVVGRRSRANATLEGSVVKDQEVANQKFDACEGILSGSNVVDSGIKTKEQSTLAAVGILAQASAVSIPTESATTSFGMDRTPKKRRRRRTPLLYPRRYLPRLAASGAVATTAAASLATSPSSASPRWRPLITPPSMLHTFKGRSRSRPLSTPNQAQYLATPHSDSKADDGCSNSSNSEEGQTVPAEGHDFTPPNSDVVCRLSDKVCAEFGSAFSSMRDSVVESNTPPATAKAVCKDAVAVDTEDLFKESSTPLSPTLRAQEAVEAEARAAVSQRHGSGSLESFQRTRGVAPDSSSPSPPRRSRRRRVESPPMLPPFPAGGPPDADDGARPSTVAEMAHVDSAPVTRGSGQTATALNTAASTSEGSGVANSLKSEARDGESTHAVACMEEIRPESEEQIGGKRRRASILAIRGEVSGNNSKRGKVDCGDLEISGVERSHQLGAEVAPNFEERHNDEKIGLTRKSLRRRSSSTADHSKAAHVVCIKESERREGERNIDEESTKQIGQCGALKGPVVNDSHEKPPSPDHDGKYADDMDCSTRPLVTKCESSVESLKVGDGVLVSCSAICRRPALRSSSSSSERGSADSTEKQGEMRLLRRRRAEGDRVAVVEELTDRAGRSLVAIRFFYRAEEIPPDHLVLLETSASTRVDAGGKKAGVGNDCENMKEVMGDENNSVQNDGENLKGESSHRIEDEQREMTSASMRSSGDLVSSLQTENSPEGSILSNGLGPSHSPGTKAVSEMNGDEVRCDPNGLGNGRLSKGTASGEGVNGPECSELATDVRHTQAQFEKQSGEESSEETATNGLGHHGNVDLADGRECSGLAMLPAVLPRDDDGPAGCGLLSENVGFETMTSFDDTRGRGVEIGSSGGDGRRLHLKPMEVLASSHREICSLKTIKGRCNVMHAEELGPHALRDCIEHSSPSPTVHFFRYCYDQSAKGCIAVGPGWTPP